MAILEINVYQSAGQVGISPYFIYIKTDDTFAEVTTTGYLTNKQSFGYTFTPNQTAIVTTTDKGNVELNVTISGSVISLTQTKQPILFTHGVIGDLPVANLNGGLNASSGTFWRGDGVWAQNGLGLTTLGRVSATATAAQLAAGGEVVLLNAGSATATYALVQIFTNQPTCTNFSGGSGNRGVVVTDNTTDLTYIPSTWIASFGPADYIPTYNEFNDAPGFLGLNQAATTQAGEDIVVKYYGGTTDWSAGQITIVAYFLQITE